MNLAATPDVATAGPTVLTLWGIVLLLAEVLGILSSFHALMNVRTSQGTVAWCIALVTFPLLSLPLYWVFGRNRFFGYLCTLRAAHQENIQLVSEVAEAIKPHHGVFDRESHLCEFALDVLTWRRFTSGNCADLLCDGQATFDAIFNAIDEAKSYLLIQFFIIKHDGLGSDLKQKLIAAVRRGVRVYVLFDEIGSHKLSNEYLDDLTTAGVQVSRFGTTQGPANRFQLNFRNHRKVVVADGRAAFVGGHNVGDEYLGRNPRFNRWRDTHIRVEGPAVQGIQTVFLEDWYWATRSIPDMQWQPSRVEGCDVCVLPLETGPTSIIEACTLMFDLLISKSRERIWIASPYFVPDEGIVRSLQLAALRGVDVRIMLPDKPDHKLVYLASFSYLEEMEAAGVKVFRYEAGFLHQKVALMDDRISVVGTANLDNRSFRLNFELSIVVSDRDFARQVCAMLEDDFANCRRIDCSDYTGRGLGFRIAVRFARLLAPIL